MPEPTRSEPDPTYLQELLRRQDALQAEARAMTEQLRLVRIQRYLAWPPDLPPAGE